MAMLQTALALDQGFGTPKDTARALHLYRQAGDHRVSDGYAWLADFYLKGEFVAQNYDSAFALVDRAYRLGGDNQIATIAMANMHLHGIGTSVDTAAAIPYLQEAARLGHGMSLGHLGDCYNVGLMYHTGEGVKKNKKEAKRWLTLAADNGHPAAADLLKTL